MFGEADYNPRQSYSAVPFGEQLQALMEAKAAGKIKEFGVSNETPWGLMRFCELGETRALKVNAGRGFLTFFPGT